MIHIFPILYRGRELSVLTYRDTSGKREIISIGGWSLDEVPPMMVAKAEAYIRRMSEYSTPQKQSNWT